ncbi:MAG: hypothetical protein GWP10_06995 [Nitrospiraceae bacterium]|nr:hypothetical protein [Nitrospiraceae bacterium]
MVLFVLPVLADEPTGTIVGTVTTAYGEGAVEGLTVVAINYSTGRRDYRQTGQDGGFRFDYLPQGEYLLAYQLVKSGPEYFVSDQGRQTENMSQADHYRVLQDKPVSVHWDLYQKLPNLDIWPCNNKAGMTDELGNPGPLSIIIDDAFINLSRLDIDTFKVMFDGIDVTSAVLQAPPRLFILNNNKIEINFPYLVFPSGEHFISLEIGDKGHEAVSIHREISIQDSKGFMIGIHIPPVEDWNAPYNDWAVAISHVNQVFSRHHTLIGYFTSWAETDGKYIDFNDFLNNQIASVGAIPVITWEPWRHGGGVNQPDYSLTAIINGNHDSYIHSYAQACRKYARPILLRIMHEFNGAYYPWAGINNNNDPKLFIQAFRHIVDIFREEGAKNVEFIWSPNYAADARVPAPSNDIEAYYPGDDYVDWIGVSGYNWGTDTRMQAQGWLSFTDIFDGPLFGHFLSTMYERHPGKKIIIAEIGCNNGDAKHSKVQWILDAYQKIALYPNIGGVVWFNNTAVHDLSGLTADFRVIENPGDGIPVPQDVKDAYRQAVGSH